MVIPCDFTQICRLCLVKDKVNVFLFDNNDTTKSILEKINSCLPVTVSENDNLPKKICDICLEKLNATYAFQNTTLNSEKQLLTWLAESSSKSASSINDVAIEVLPDTSIVKEEAPDPDIANELNEELHSQIEETEEPVPKRPRRSTALNRPVIEPDTEEDEDVDDVEPISKFESEDEDLEKLDIPSYLDPTTLADQPGPSGVGKESGEPTSMNDVFDKYNDIQVENLNESDGEITIIYDHSDDNKDNGGSVKTDDELIKMVLEKYERNNYKQLCVSCGKLRCDGSCITSTKKFTCEICQEFFPYKNLLREHRKLHEIKCKECGSKFTSIWSLSMHRFQHIGFYSCYLCNYKTKKWGECLDHLTEHKSVKYTCDKCGKKLTTKTALGEHMQIHDGIPKFRCKLCPKVFVLEKYLKTHEKFNHTKAKDDKHLCSECGKMFSFKASLRRHLRVTHNIGMSFKVPCPICGKIIANNYNLKLHISSFHTGDKQYCCEKCAARFAYKCHLKRHLECFHLNK